MENSFVLERRVAKPPAQTTNGRPFPPGVQPPLNERHQALLAEPRLLVVDLEATCGFGEGVVPQEVSEVIEVGMAWLDADGTVRSATQLVRNVHTPLTAYCTELTSITAETLADAPTFQPAMHAVGSLLQQEQPTAWTSWGGFDQRQLERQARREGVLNPFEGLPYYDAKWLLGPLIRWQREMRRGNLRYQVGTRGLGLAKALEALGLEFEGKHHRGVDDAYMTARIVQRCRELFASGAPSA